MLSNKSGVIPLPPCHLPIPVHLPQKVSWGYMLLTEGLGKRASLRSQVMTGEETGPLQLAPCSLSPTHGGFCGRPGPSVWEAPAGSHGAPLGRRGRESGRYEVAVLTLPFARCDRGQRAGLGLSAYKMALPHKEQVKRWWVKQQDLLGAASRAKESISKALDGTGLVLSWKGVVLSFSSRSLSCSARR